MHAATAPWLRLHLYFLIINFCIISFVFFIIFLYPQQEPFFNPTIMPPPPRTAAQTACAPRRARLLQPKRSRPSCRAVGGFDTGCNLPKAGRYALLRKQRRRGAIPPVATKEYCPAGAAQRKAETPAANLRTQQRRDAI